MTPRDILLTQHGDAQLAILGLSKLPADSLHAGWRVESTAASTSAMDTGDDEPSPYLDPEYLSSGTISPTCDTFALGA